MAAMPAVSGTTTFTPPSSAQEDYTGWKFASSGHHHHHDHDNSTHQRPPLDRHETNGSLRGGTNGDPNYDLYAADNPSVTKDLRTSRSTTNSFSEYKRLHPDMSPEALDEEHSKWIHRDKLARIESEELQAAGIILPKPRAASRPRRDRSQDKTNGHRRGTDASEQQPLPRSRKNSDMSLDRTPEVEVPSWDLRLPEEIAEDPSEYWVAPESAKGSRIPVAKLSPAPIPVDFLERDAVVPRKSGSHITDEDGSITLPKPRSRSSSTIILDDVPKSQPGKRSATDASPKKGTTPGTKKTSATVKSASQGRPKTRSGPAPRSGSATRPTTRSGELSPSMKSPPEGEPPWMVSAYKPDPRLPPDQQLLPTVAKRLQQEKWEQEGKFGNVYDKEFRPLNDEPFLKPEKTKDGGEQQDEWPLRPNDKKPPSPNRPGTSSYSTMPKIQDKPMVSPLTSPLSVQQPQQTPQATEMPEQPQEKEEPKKKEAGCGCCVVM
ncbi:hypothetical protein F4779DRAFT_195719 [Xylariaceae sp. FL0662B]|nr:hypothetical protein F4779DRAFT_195719 [Xylariaceae sp. FL0662B]